MSEANNNTDIPLLSNIVILPCVNSRENSKVYRLPLQQNRLLSAVMDKYPETVILVSKKLCLFHTVKTVNKNKDTFSMIS